MVIESLLLSLFSLIIIEYIVAIYNLHYILLHLYNYTIIILTKRKILLSISSSYIVVVAVVVAAAAAASAAAAAVIVVASSSVALFTVSIAVFFCLIRCFFY
jgi:hypothetical protein